MRFIKDVTWDTAKLLERIYKHSTHYKFRQRSHCIVLSYKGKNIQELMVIFKKAETLYITG